jgi:hypothetical protein
MSGGCWPAASSRRDVHDAPKTAPVWPRVSGRGLGRPGRVGHRSVDLACGVDGCNRRVPRSARHPGTLQALVAVTGILPASLLGVAAGGIYGFVSGSPGFYRLWFVMMLPACTGRVVEGGRWVDGPHHSYSPIGRLAKTPSQRLPQPLSLRVFTCGPSVGSLRATFTHKVVN